MNRIILAFLWFVTTAVETDCVQNVPSKGHELAAVQEAAAKVDAVAGAGEGLVEAKEDVDVELEKSLAEKGGPRRRRRRDRRRRRRRRFRRRRRRRRRRRTPSPTPVPTPMPTPVPTPMPTPVPTVKAGKGKGGSLFEEEESDYAEEAGEGSTPAEIEAWFKAVDAHLKATNVLEGEALSGDPILIFCNGLAYEMDPSAGVTTLLGLNHANEAEAAVNAQNKDISLTISAPLISTVSQFLTKATVPPAPAEITIWFNGVQEPDSIVRQMDDVKALKYGLSVTWLKGLDLASM